MIYDMIRCDIWYMIWCDMIWYMIWCDIWVVFYVIWCDMIYIYIWYDVIWYNMIYDMIWYDVIWYIICDTMWYDIYDMMWYDMIQYDMIYLLTAIVLSPDGSVTVHIYTQTIHRTTQITNLEASVEITNKMQPCNRIYYSTVHWRLKMFRAAYRSSSGALTAFAACGLHTHVVTSRSQVWVGTQWEKVRGTDWVFK